MGDDDVSKLQPPKLFGRRTAKPPRVESPAGAVTETADAPQAQAPTETGAAQVPTDVPADAPADAPAASKPATKPRHQRRFKHDKPDEPDQPDQAPAPATADTEPEQPRVPKRPTRSKRPKSAAAPRRMPKIPAMRRPAGLALVALTGILSGAVLTGLTWAFLQLDPGEHLTFIYVVLVFIAAVALGWLALRMLGVRSPGTISFLGTGIIAMVAICVGSGPLETLGGAIGVIVGSMPAYAISGWVTARFIDQE